MQNLCRGENVLQNLDQDRLMVISFSAYNRVPSALVSVEGKHSGTIKSTLSSPKIPTNILALSEPDES